MTTEAAARLVPLATPEQALTNAAIALKTIQLYPEFHDQNQWRCSTGMCLAGWIVADWVAQPGTPLQFHPTDPASSVLYTADGRDTVILEHAATRLLGFNPDLTDLQVGDTRQDELLTDEDDKESGWRDIANPFDSHHTNLEDLVEQVAGALSLLDPEITEERLIERMQEVLPEEVPDWLHADVDA